MRIPQVPVNNQDMIPGGLIASGDSFAHLLFVTASESSGCYHGTEVNIMKQVWKDLALAVMLGLVLPGLLLHLAVKYGNDVRQTGEENTVTEAPSEPAGRKIPVLNDEGEVEEMELDFYLVGVLLAEMPASFELEALKAQAVVARTYTIHAEDSGKHINAAVCTDSTCCQEYRATEDYLAQGGKNENIEKMQQAVRETSDLVLTYDGQLIEATYFSCSGGMTEDAVAVWGTEVPYLQAVASPGEESATFYADQQVFSREEICRLLQIDSSNLTGKIFGNATYTAGGGVDIIFVNGQQMQGTQVRKILGLRSTAFTVTEEADSVTFHTRGFGHRVGMSQYGADAMAVEGATFDQILAHYYRGTAVQKLSD